MSRRNVMVCLVLAGVVTAGCNEPGGSGGPAASAGASSSAPAADGAKDLRLLSAAYLDYHDVHGQGPSSWEELTEFSAGQQDRVDAIQRVREAGYQVQWGVRMRDVTTGIGTFVLAQSPQGGPKLMLDGAIDP